MPSGPLAATLSSQPPGAHTGFLVVAQGAFEYFGGVQERKFAEIKKLLTDDGTFIVSYWNFGHRNARIYEPFTNIQPLNDFRASLSSYFRINSSFPASHNWRHNMSDRKLLKAINMHVNMNIPFVSPRLAVEYFFICSPLGREGYDEPAGQ